jgi:hypothetical protein
MLDPTSIMAAVGSLKTILDLALNVKDAQIALRISTAVADAQGRLIDVQQQTLALQADNQLLRDEIRQLKDAAEDEKRFEFMHGVYWKTRDVETERLGNDGDPIIEVRYDGPFCPTCRDADKKAVRMRYTGASEDKLLFWCDIHKIPIEVPQMNY